MIDRRKGLEMIEEKIHEAHSLLPPEEGSGNNRRYGDAIANLRNALSQATGAINDALRHVKKSVNS